MDASVSLNAIDNVTGPTSSALSSISKYQAALDSMSSLTGGVGNGSINAAYGVKALGEAAEASVIPHRAAHQALALVSGEMGALAGASTAAHGAITVVDSVLFQLAMTGGAISMGFVAATAAVVGLVTVISSMVEAGKKADEQYTSLLASVKALGPASNEAALATIHQAQALATQYQAQLLIEQQSPTMGAKLSSALATVEPASKAAVAQLAAFAKAMFSPIAAAQDLASGTEAAMNKTASSLAKPNAAISDLQKKINDLTAATTSALANMPKAVDPIAAEFQKLHDGLNQFIEQMESKVSQAITKDTEQLVEWGEKAGYTYHQTIALADAAQAMGIGWEKASAIITKTDQLITQSVGNMVSTVTDSLAQMLINGQGTWSSMMNGLLKTVGDALKQVGEMWLAADLMVSMGIGPQSIGSAIALIAIGSIVGALATPKVGNLGASSASSGSSGSSSGSSGAAGATGAGGTAVSSAQQIVNNNISIVLPVEALDLSSVADSQMRSLANRIARLIAQGATGGQLSLAGA